MIVLIEWSINLKILSVQLKLRHTAFNLIALFGKKYKLN